MGLQQALQKAAGIATSIPGIGQDVVIRAVTPGSYNTTTGVISESTSDTTLKGVFSEINAREVTGLVQADDRKLTVAADNLSSAPTTKDRVVYGGVNYQVIRVKTVMESGVDITYQLFLRA